MAITQLKGRLITKIPLVIIEFGGTFSHPQLKRDMRILQLFLVKLSTGNVHMDYRGANSYSYLHN